MYNPLFVQVSILSCQISERSHSDFQVIGQEVGNHWCCLFPHVSPSCAPMHSFFHPNTCKCLLSRLAPCSNGMLWWSQKDGVNEGKANDFSAAKEEKHINSYLHIMPSGRYILQRWSINNLLCQKCDTLNKVKSTALTVSLKIISN